MKKTVLKILATAIVSLLCVSFFACSPTAGKSAYEIACENGFSGTVTEWLESLKGEDGRDGRDGRDGQDGVDGEDGADFNVEALYEAYLELYPDADFEDFLGVFATSGDYGAEYAAARGVRSVVCIWAQFYGITGYDKFNRAIYGTYYSGGAGVIYRHTGGYYYIITNYHVVYDYTSTERPETGRSDHLSEEILVYGYEGTEAVAEFIGGSVSKDIAVLKSADADLPGYLEPAVIADSNAVALGERAVAVGNPMGYGTSVTSGIISVDSEEIEMSRLDAASGTVTARVMRIDTPVNHGNSGGGLFNIRGELLGIVNAKEIDADYGVENMGYAIPVNVAAGIAGCVIENDSKKLVLGITVTSSSVSVAYNALRGRIEITETVVVDSVNAGALADGLLQAGDMLVSVSLNGGEPLTLERIFFLSDFLYRVRTGDTVRLGVKRGGSDIALDMTAGSAFFAAV